MGDISELRGLIVVATFLGVFVLLIAWIPSELYTASGARTVYVPEIFEAIDIYSYAETKIICMNETGGHTWASNPSYYYFDDADIGGRDLDFVYKKANESDLKLFIRHIWYEWIFFPYDHNLEFFNREGISRNDYVEVSEMEADSDGNGTVSYRAVCEHLQIYTHFGYNATLYSNFTNAWNFHGLYAFFGIDFSQVETSYNAFHLIAILLFFQLPDVNIYVNAILAIPIWICVAYISFILILRALGAIFGGGGA